MKRFYIVINCLLAVFLLVVFSSNCVKRVSPPSTQNDAQTSISKEEFVKLYGGQNLPTVKKATRTPILYPGDEISIAIYDKLPVSQEKRIEMKRISDEGTIFLLPAKEISIGGLTLTEAEKRIENKLSQFIVSPFVEITIMRRAFEPRVYIFGEVGKNGTVMLKEGDRLLDVISSAGGCTENAYRRSIKIIRIHENNVSMISLNLYDIMNQGKIEQNILMQDQDVVFVPRRFYTNFREVMSILNQFLPWYYFSKNFITF